MQYTVYSYRHAEEILASSKWSTAWEQLADALKGSPLFVYASKSPKNGRLDVLQQLQNTYFERRLAVDYRWLFHPPATRIPDSDLATDFRNTFNYANESLTVQVEVQFGNMSRWYSDVFKFQAAYSEGLADIGVSIVPLSSLAQRVDSNIVSFERCLRELPAAKLSITLPILLIGVDADANTAIYNVRECRFARLSDVTGKGSTANRFRIVNGFLDGASPESVSVDSPTGPMPGDAQLIVDASSDDEDEE